MIGRELLIDLVSTAYMEGKSFFMRDVIMPQLGKLNVQAYKYTGYVARICGMKSYFEENMKLLDDYNLDALFSTRLFTRRFVTTILLVILRGLR